MHRSLLGVFWRRRALIVATATIPAALTCIAGLQETTRHIASATIDAEAPFAVVAGGGANSEPMSALRRALSSELARSESVAAEISAHEGTWLRRVQQVMPPLPSVIETKLPLLQMLMASENAEQRQAVEDRLLTMLSITRDERSRELRFQVAANDRGIALLVTAAAVEAYRGARDAAILRSRQQAEERLRRAREALDASEATLQQLEQQEWRGRSQHEATLTTQLSSLVAERLRKEKQLQEVKRTREVGSSVEGGAELLPAKLLELKAQENQLVRRKAQLDQKFLALHPAVIKVNRDLQQLRQEIDRTVSDALRAGTAELNALKTEEVALRARMAQPEPTANRTDLEALNHRRQDVEANRVEYREAIAKLAEVTAWHDAAHGGARTLAQPSLSETAHGAPAIFIGGALLSIAFGCGIAVLAERRRQWPVSSEPCSEPRRRSTASIVTAGIFALLGGSGLMALSAPRLLASLLALPGDRVLDAIRADPATTMQVGDIDLLIASRQSLLALAPSGRAKTDLGLAYLLRAGSTNERDAQRLILEHAVLHLRSGLAEAPARPHAWTRLALAEIALNGPSANAAAAFKLAVETGRYDRALVLARVRLGLALESYLPPTGKRLLEDQIRIAWDVRGSELMTLADETGTGAVIEAALQGRQ